MLPLLAPGCQGIEVHPMGSHKMLSLLFLCDLRIVLDALGTVFGSATGNRTRVLRLRISRPNPWTIAPHLQGAAVTGHSSYSNKKPGHGKGYEGRDRRREGAQMPKIGRASCRERV